MPKYSNMMCISTAHLTSDNISWLRSTSVLDAYDLSDDLLTDIIIYIEKTDAENLPRNIKNCIHIAKDFNCDILRLNSKYPIVSYLNDRVITCSEHHPPKIRKVLTLPITMLTPESIRFCKTFASMGMPEVKQKGDSGWFIDVMHAISNDALTECLQTRLWYARNEGCDIVCFDNTVT